MLKHRLKLPRKGLFFIWFCLLAGTALFAFGHSPKSYAANPTTINFQGKVTNANSTNEASGSVSRAFVFRLYNNVNISTYNPNTLSCASDSNCVWEESDTLTVTDGVFQVELGAVCPFFTSNSCNKSTPIDFNSLNSLSMTMQFKADAAGFMTPLWHLQSVPYAYNADKLGGIAASGFIQNTTSPQSSSNFNISGTGVAGTALQAPILQTASGDLALQPASGIVALNKASTANELRVYENAVSPSNYASITATSSDATFKSNTGITKIGNGTGAITLSAGAGSAVNITGNAASLWQTSSGNITVQAGSGTVTLGTTTNLTSTNGLTVQGGSTLSLLSTTGSTISLDSGTIGAVQIGTGGNNKAITIGSTTAGTTVSLTGGTTANTAITLSTSGAGGITIDSGTTGNINIGTGTGSGKAVAIGSTNSGTTVTSTAGAVTDSLSNTGSTIQTNTNSATAFRVLNSAGLSGITIDTTGGNANNIVSNPSFETVSTTWASIGTTPSTISRTTGQFYNGANALDVLTNAEANDGVKINVFTGSGFQASTTYNLALYVKASIPMNASLNIGRADVSGTDIICASNQTNYGTGWFRYLCSFKTGVTVTNPYILVKQSDTVSRHIYIDAVLMQTEANADANYRDAKITVGGTITSSLILQPGADSNTAFMIQDTNGAGVLTVDTTDNNNIVLNPSFEVNTTNWAVKGGDTIGRDTTQQKHGLASLKLTAQGTPAANDGTQYTLPASLPATTYAISFDVKLSVGAFGAGTLVAGLVESGVDQNCTALSPAVTATVPTTTGWTRFSCTRVAAAAPTALYIKQTDTAAHTYFIDSVQMEIGSTVTPYGLGRLSFSGEIITPTTFRNQSDSTLAFQVQNAAASNLFSIDTLNGYLQIGSSTTDATAIQLVLDSYSTSADPTAAGNGAMYYNTGTNVFRCRQNGVWRNCIESPSNASVADQSPTAATLTYLTGSSITIPQGGVRAGTQFTWRMSLSKTVAGVAQPVFAVVFGTNGTTADTARASFTLPVETAVVDTGQITIFCTVRSVSATATISCNLQMTHNDADNTGFIAAGATNSEFVSTVTSGTFDDTVANSIIGVTVNSGTANAFTFQQVQAQSINL